VADVELSMKPLGKAKSLSPLKQLRTYSYRSLSSEDNYLDKEVRVSFFAEVSGRRRARVVCFMHGVPR
jgi:hypothetical protein